MYQGMRRWPMAVFLMLFVVFCRALAAESQTTAEGPHGEIVVQAEDFSSQGGGKVTVEGKPRAQGKAFRNWDNVGHWLEWTVRVPAAGEYRLVLRYATEVEFGDRRVEIDGKPLRGLEQVRLPGTGGWNEWVETPLPATFALSSGEHTLRMTGLNTGGSINLDWIKLTPARWERLLLGFERSETEGLFVKGLESGVVQETEQGYRLIKKKGDHWRMFPSFELRRSHATEGEFALHHWVSSPVTPTRTIDRRRLREFTLPERVAYYYHPFPQSLMIVNGFHWWRLALPVDWSAFEVLRLDVFVENARGPAGVVLRVAIEDEEVEPPATRFFKVPDRQPVTLELDLKDLAASRDLDLAKLVDWWLAVEQSEGATHVCIDNIRLAKRNAPLALPAVEPQEPLKYAPLPSQPRRGGGERLAPVQTPLELEEPIVVVPPGEDIVAFRPSGWVAAFDNEHLFLAFSGFRGRENVWNKSAPLVAMQSVDGGKTWTGLGGAENPTLLWSGAWLNLDHGSGCGEAVDAQGDGFFMTSAGCCGPGVCAPRLFVEKIEFFGRSGWRARQQKALLDCDIRHCGSSFSCIRLPSGRLWAATGQTSRLGANVSARYSDDDGLTWHSWQEVAGKTAAIPGSEGDYRGKHQYASKHVTLTRFGDHLACFWQDLGGLKWSRFDGDEWSPAEVIAEEAGGTRSTDLVFAVTRGEDEVHMTAPKVPGVLRWDGERWVRELPDAAPNGRLSLAGDTVMLFTVEEGKTPSSWPMTQGGGTTIACYAKPNGGAWSARRELVREEVPFTTYRAMQSVVVPRYSPPNFVPLAWTGLKESYIKLLRVPVPLPAGPGGSGDAR